MYRRPSKYVTILPSLVVIGTLVVEINHFRLSRDIARPRDQGVIRPWLGALQDKLGSYQVSWP